MHTWYDGFCETVILLYTSAPSTRVSNGQLDATILSKMHPE